LHIAVVAVIIGAALVGSLLLIVPHLSLNILRSSDTPKRIYALDPKGYTFGTIDKPVTLTAVRVNDLKPNSFVWFLDPYGKTMQKLLNNHVANTSSFTLDRKETEQFQNIDSYEYYMLIRLPEWLGGQNDGNDNDNDASSLRAYHSISLSDKCTARYWPTEGRWRIENPCAGDMYRPWDGYAFAGPAYSGFVGMVPSRGYHPALQMLKLSVDREGYVVAFRPDNKPQGDGTQGEGRQMSPDDLEKSNKDMILEASKYSGYALPLPASIPPNYVLSELNPAGGPWWMTQQPEDTKKWPLEATYSSAGIGEYAPITIDIFSLERFPDMAPGGTLIKRSGAFGYVVNSTIAGRLIHLDYYHYSSSPDGGGMELLQTRNGTDIAGEYAVLTAPSKLKEGENPGAGALVWGKSSDGKKDILVVINARRMPMYELVHLVEGIGIKS
jgi:hypothetical protein